LAALSCDDPDGNCQLTDYYGHWRGDNATDETVICEKSFQGRRPLEQTCGFGFQLGTDKPSTSACASQHSCRTVLTPIASQSGPSTSFTA
jgi:hypothetical protein